MVIKKCRTIIEISHPLKLVPLVTKIHLKHKIMSLFLKGVFYQDDIGETECKRCSVGTYVSVEHHPGRSASDCLACPCGKQYALGFLLKIVKLTVKAVITLENIIIIIIKTKATSIFIIVIVVVVVVTVSTADSKSQKGKSNGLNKPCCLE